MAKGLLAFLTALTFYAFSTDAYRIGVAGFSLPLPLLALCSYSLFFASKIYRSKRFQWAIAFFLFFFAVGVFSAIINSPVYSIPFLVKLVFCFLVFVAAYLVSSNIANEELIRFVFHISICSSLFAAAHVFYYYFVLKAPYLSIALDGIISEAGKNQLANYLGALFVLSFCVYQTVEKGSERLLCGAATFIHFVALLYTFSRSALIVSLVASMIFFFLSSIRQRSARGRGQVFLLSAVIVGSVSYGVSLPEELVDQFLENLWSVLLFEDKGDSTSINVRGQLIFDAFEFFRTSPLLGHGPGAFVATIGIATHNSYIQLLAEVGIFGTLAFCGLVAVVVIGPWIGTAAHILTAVVCFLAGSLFFQNALDSPFLYIFLGLCVGAHVGLRDREV